MRRAATTIALVVAVLAVAPARAADPTPADCARASEQSLSLRKEGKLRDARAALATCAAASCPAEIRSECEKRFAEVNGAMPTVVFDVRDAGGKDVPDVKIAMDGVALAERAGAVFAADPGTHKFRFEAPGMAAQEQTFVLRETEKNRREAIVMKAAAPPPPPVPTATSTPTPTLTPTPTPTPIPTPAATLTPATASPSHSSSQKTIGLVLGAVGVVGLGVGTYFGLSASGKWSDSQNECASPTQCPQHAQAVSDRDDAQSAAMTSTIAFAAGGVALAAGAVLWLTAPKEGAGVAVVPAAGGMNVVGRF